MLTAFVIIAVLFLVACGLIGSFIGKSGKEYKASKKEFEKAKHELELKKLKCLNDLENTKYKKQAEQLKELYKDLNRDIAEIERKIKQIRGED